MKKLTKEEFIKRAIAKHGEGRYDYSGVVYKNSSTEVEIKCNVCGKIFFQRPDSHLQGKGCRYCGYKKSHPLTTLDEFFRKARVVHGDKYDYSQVKFEKVKDKITIICPEHGPFSQAVINHYFGQGCPKCGIKKNAQKLRSNTDDFVKKAKIIHGDKYNYDLVKYVNNRTPIQIICNTCETEFSQTPHSHLLGRGCLNCANNQPIGTEEFIRRAKEVWGDRYLYDKVNHKGNKKKLLSFVVSMGNLNLTHMIFSMDMAAQNVLEKHQKKLEEKSKSSLSHNVGQNMATNTIIPRLYIKVANRE